MDDYSAIPVQVHGSGDVGYLTDIVAIAGGGYHSITLRVDGIVWTFGANWAGQLGDGTTTDKLTPVQVHGPDNEEYITDIIAIAGGGHHSAAMRADETVWTWGYNLFGQLGDGTINDTPWPVKALLSW